jgi:hypothetical protein
MIANPADPREALLLGLFIDEIQANASEEEQIAFYRAVGTHLAKRFPVKGEGDAHVLERELNAVFQRLGFGRAEISVAEDALYIRHHLAAGAGAIPEREEPWQLILPLVLEGAYDAWLRTLGSGPRLHTTMSFADHDTLEYRHGL